jgi:hypothetical protein
VLILVRQWTARMVRSSACAASGNAPIEHGRAQLSSHTRRCSIDGCMTTRDGQIFWPCHHVGMRRALAVLIYLIPACCLGSTQHACHEYCLLQVLTSSRLLPLKADGRCFMSAQLPDRPSGPTILRRLQKSRGHCSAQTCQPQRHLCRSTPLR